MKTLDKLTASKSLYFALFSLDLKFDNMNIPDIKLELQTDVNDVKPETTQLMYNLLDIEGTHFNIYGDTPVL